MFTTICALSHYAAKLRVGFLLALSPLLTVPLGAQTPHFTFNGGFDQMGHSVAGAGDVNQDGFDDVIVGAPSADGGGFANGSVYVYSGKDGNLLWQFDGAVAFDQLGRSVAGAGDVNQDGFDDLIVGALTSPGIDPVTLSGGIHYAGSAYVYSGKDGTILWQFDGAAADDYLGESVAGAGDVNQDGFDDVIVGAPGLDAGALNSVGAIYVYSGKDGTGLWRLAGAAAGDRLGYSVAGAGDVNQDGGPDVVAGAYRADPSGTLNAGSAYVFSGKGGNLLWQFDGAAAGDYLGWSVAGAGDVNQDGFDDVIVGAPYAAPGGKIDAGSAYVYSGKDGTKLWQFAGPAAGDRLGFSVAGAGDVNQDGFDELIVGAPYAAPGGKIDAGSAYVYSGKGGNLLWRFDGDLKNAGSQHETGERLGRSVAGAGDVNQDGFADVIVGTSWLTSGFNFAPSGSAYVYTIFQASFSVFGNGCPGSVGTPELAIASGHLPLIGETFNILLSGMPTAIFNVPYGFLGFSKTSWGGIPLPYDLSNLGFWNCTQFISLDFTIALVNNGGVATWAIPVPNNPNLIGLSFYVQGVVIDLGVNPGNAINTNAAEGVIGG